MNDLKRFTCDNFQVRTIKIGNDVWFVAKDISKILGYRMASDATKILDRDATYAFNAYERW